MDSTLTILVSKLNSLKKEKYEAMRVAAEPYVREIEKVETLIKVYEEGAIDKQKVGNDYFPEGITYDAALPLFEDEKFLKPKELAKRIGMTTQEMVLHILRERGGGMIALDILDAINKKWKLGLARTSLSPQLSRLKDKGKLSYTDGGLWKLVK